VAEVGRVVIYYVLVEQGRRLADQLGPACTFQLLDVTSENRHAAFARTRGKYASGPAGLHETGGHQGKIGVLVFFLLSEESRYITGS
jgi:hypothetical protein